MKFEEKKRMKKEEIADLFKGLGELIEKDELNLGGEALPVPNSAEVEVEYKEKKGRAKLEIEVKWRLENAKDRLPKEENSIGEVKQSIKKAFNGIRSTVEGGSIPSDEDVADFMKLSNTFNRLAKGEIYEGDMAGYMAMVHRLGETVKTGNTAELKALIEEMRAAKKSCHKTYRWKEA
jgi:XXXCH domain-containing protein